MTVTVFTKKLLAVDGEVEKSLTATVAERPAIPNTGNRPPIKSSYQILPELPRLTISSLCVQGMMGSKVSYC